MKRSYITQRGMNLIEILGVLAITLILAWMLYPFIMRSRPGDRYHPASICASNEKQIGLGILQYAQDNDNLLLPGNPALRHLSPTTHAGLGWAGEIYSYVKSTGCFRCPEDEYHDDSPPTVSYGYNSNLAQGPLGKAVSLIDVITSNTTVLCFEVAGSTADIEAPDEGAAVGMTTFSAVGNGTDGSLRSALPGQPNLVRYATGYLGGRIPPSEPGQFLGAIGRHNNGSNFLLADGHVKWLPPDKVSSGANALKPTAAQTGTTLGRAAGIANGDYPATFSIR